MMKEKFILQLLVGRKVECLPKEVSQGSFYPNELIRTCGLVFVCACVHDGCCFIDELLKEVPAATILDAWATFTGKTIT